MTATFDASLYPAAGETHHGRPTWDCSEDEPDMVVAAGHDRRAVAALSAARRAALETWGVKDEHFGREVVRDWWVFHTTCGCTEEQHAAHSDEIGSCDTDDCARYGLPPCREDVHSWVGQYRDVEATTPGALPVVYVRADG